MDKPKQSPAQPWVREAAVRPTPTELVFRSLLDHRLPVTSADTPERLRSAKASRIELIGEACFRVGTRILVRDDGDQAVVHGEDGRLLARIWFESDPTQTAISVRWELSDETTDAVKRWLDEGR